MEQMPRPLLDDSLENRLDELLLRASKDALSGLLNRATTQSHVGLRLRDMDEGASCALFIFDLDSFKAINDTLGHQAGDEAIRQTARLLSSIFRASDIVGRLGGDEFVVFMTGDLDESTVRERGEQVCRGIELVLDDGGRTRLTASAGICISDGPMDFDSLYREADEALYQAKGDGGGTCRIRRSAGGVDPSARGHLDILAAMPMSSLLESMDSGVAMLDVSSQEPRITYASPALCRMLGIQDRRPVPASTLEDRIHPDDYPLLVQKLKEASGPDGGVDVTVRISCPSDGSWMWWRFRAAGMDAEEDGHSVLVAVSDVTAFKRTQIQLEDVNERLRMAFDQTSQRLWEVDIPARTFTTYIRKDDDEAPSPSSHPFPDYLVENGIVHPDSVDRFTLFARNLLAGQSEGHGNFIMRYQDTGCYGWVSLSYRMIHDEVGHAVRAVGISDDISASFSSQSPESIPQEMLPQALLYGLVLRMRLDLSKDRVEELWVDGRDMLAQPHRPSCDDALGMLHSQIVPSDGSDVLDWSLDRLVSRYESGCRWMLCECRRVDMSGSFSKVRILCHLDESETTHDVTMDAYMLQVELPDDWTAALAEGMGRDPVSGLYDKDSIVRFAQKVFRVPSSKMRAVSIFQVNGLAGQPAATQKELMEAIGALLSIAMGGDCVLGQYGSERIIMLMPALSSRDALRHRLEEAMSMMRRVLRNRPLSDSTRFVAGLGVQEAGQVSLDHLITGASYACSRRWNSPVDSVAYADEGEDRSWMMIQSTQGDDQISVLSAEARRPLTDSEKEVAFNCMSAMLGAATLEDSISGVLRNIGVYYQADRVYVLTLAADRRVVTMPFEWDDPCKCSIQQVVSGMLLEKFPLLVRCIEEKSPVFLERRQEIRHSGKDRERREDVWRFTTYPLFRHDRLDGFLCIENSRRYPTSAALFSTLIPYMLHEQERFSGSSGAAGTVEQLMGLPDLRSFMGTIYSLDGSRYSSLGAICLDIPGMAAINSSQGFEYGSRLLWYVSKTLTDIFGPSLLFRTWEAEFIAFCPNTTQQVFQGRCARLASILQRRYPRDIRIGIAWAEGTFTGRRLVDEARRSMHVQKPDVQLSKPPIIGAMQEHLEMAGEPESRPLVHFQPIVDMRTGRILAAEALVRGMDGDGNVIPPSRFIDMLERDGSIRELDLFVLDEALRQLDRWRSMGLGDMRVSVNLSRVTLLYPSTIASILAIQSRYPHLAPDSLELEITESSDVMGNREFGDLVDRLRSYGFRVSLDDFGSRYANLSLFTDVRFDTVKLDRSLIGTMAENGVSRMLVKDLVTISHSRDMICVAEGVEKEEQVAALLDAGCSYAQGYFFGRPLPASEFEDGYLSHGRAAVQCASHTGQEYSKEDRHE